MDSTIESAKKIIASEFSEYSVKRGKVKNQEWWGRLIDRIEDLCLKSYEAGHDSVLSDDKVAITKSDKNELEKLREIITEKIEELEIKVNGPYSKILHDLFESIKDIYSKKGYENCFKIHENKILTPDPKKTKCVKSDICKFYEIEEKK